MILVCASFRTTFFKAPRWPAKKTLERKKIQPPATQATQLILISFFPYRYGRTAHPSRYEKHDGTIY